MSSPTDDRPDLAVPHLTRFAGMLEHDGLRINRLRRIA